MENNNTYKYRFLNYKHYDRFIQDLNAGLIDNKSIVFIQDRLRIWARGLEYICDDVSNDIESNRVLILELMTRITALERAEVNKMITISNRGYLSLVEAGAIDVNTYYFIYEGLDDEDADQWGFGDRFPIVFGENVWKFGDKFPIVLSNKWAFGDRFPILLN